MRRPAAAAGSTLFFAIAPGVVAGLVPWWLTRWQVRGPLAHWAPVRVAGLIMLILGAIVLVQAFARFVAEGHGTPAPVAPTERLVIGGLYRYVRNPMYLAVVATITGQGLLLNQPVLLGYARRLGDRRLVRPLVRGADAGPPVRRAVPVLPARRPGLAAAHPSLASGPAGLGDGRFRGNAPPAMAPYKPDHTVLHTIAQCERLIRGESQSVNRRDGPG